MDTAGARRVESGAGPGAEVVTDLGVQVYVLGDYWQPDGDERTEIGWLVHRAKDQSDAAAEQELAERFASLACVLPDTPDGSRRLIVPVPSSSVPPGEDRRGPAADVAARPASSPVPPGEDCRRTLAHVLAEAVAAAGAGECWPDVVIKSNTTPRLRHIDPERRPQVAVEAGYRATEQAAGRHVVVVDDVVLTGTTIAAIGTCLHEAGAASVIAAVAARTRLG